MRHIVERFLFLVPVLLALFLSSGCDVATVQRANAQPETVVEIVAFEGGYGIDWHKDVAAKYSELNRDRHVRVVLWGDPRIEEKIRPRILRRCPPGAGDCMLPVWKLIVAGKLYPLDEFLDSPSYDTPGKTWRETFVPGILETFMYEGKSYAAPLMLYAWMVWYDRKLFREHGWQVPETWGEFVALCERIKTAGIAPLAFQGKYPEYAWFTFMSLIQRVGGLNTFYRCQNIEPGAFVLPEVVRAATMLQDMAVKYFQPGSSAMSHTESQMEFVNRRAAMVFCGLWLENEMRDATPPDFEMSCFSVPAVEDGRGDPRAINCGGGHNWVIFRDSKYPRETGNFLKYLLSVQNARDFTRRVNTLTTIRDAARPEDISPALLPAYEAVNRATGLFAERLTLLYLQWNDDVMVNAIGQFTRGEISPTKFCQLLEKGLEEVRRDPEIYKPPPIPLPE
jgi:N-acetylglucosamine transport system substrate-binding protein